MRGSNRPAFQLVRRIIVALAVFLALDTAIFRTSMYSRFLSPDSIVGTAAYYLMTRDGLSRPPCTGTADYAVSMRHPTPTNYAI